MQQQISLTEAVEEFETLTAPSVRAASTTFAAMTRSVRALDADCQVVTQTLETLDDALDMFKGGEGSGQQWSGFGMIGLPMMAAVRMVKGVAGQYVKQQTGTPLSSWVDFVDGSAAEFSSYLAQLARVAEIAEQRTGTSAPAEPDQLLADLELLRETQWQTRAWKQILRRVAQLGQVVDAVLKVDVSAFAEPESESSDSGGGLGFAGRLQRQLKDVQSRTAERTGDLRHWLMQPFVDLRDRTRQLPAQTDRLARQVSLLEVLLDLEIAQLRALLGGIPAAEVRLIGLRVAASVRLPELAEQLAETRGALSELGGFLARLDAAQVAGQVGESASSKLRVEYLAAQQHHRIALADLELQADTWRRDGLAVIDECAAWAADQLDVMEARRLVEQAEPDAERWALLTRERERLAEVHGILTTL